MAYESGTEEAKALTEAIQETKLAKDQLEATVALQDLRKRLDRVGELLAVVQV